MEKNVIYRNDQEIINEIEFISLAASQFNVIGKELVKIGVSKPTVFEIIEGINLLEKEQNPQILFNWLRGLLVFRMEAPKIDGLKLDKEKLKDLVTIEADAKPLYNALENAFHIKYSDKRGLLTEYLQTGDNGEIKLLENFDKLVHSRHTRKAESEEQTEVLGHIKQIIKSINAIEKIADKKGFSLFVNALYSNPLTEIPYIKFLGSKTIVPNSEYIRKF